MTEETTKVLEELRGIVNSFVIRGSGVAGNIRNGYTVNPGSGQISSGSGGGGITPTTSGACCSTAGDCFIATQAICEAGGGTYQGDNTTCEPDPCATCPAEDAATINIIFDGLLTCPTYTDVSLNGTFVLTNFEVGGWVGTGGQFDQGFGAQDAFIFATCLDGVFTIVYSGDTGFGTPQFFVSPLGSVPSVVDNSFVSCADGGAGFGGTATIS